MYLIRVRIYVDVEVVGNCPYVKYVDNKIKGTVMAYKRRLVDSFMTGWTTCTINLRIKKDNFPKMNIRRSVRRENDYK